MLKKIKPFLKKNFLFLIPIFLLTLYFLYPIPISIFKSIPQTINEKEEINEIITTYESQKTLHKGDSPEEVKRQWEEKCIKDCLSAEPYSPTGSFSSEEICELRCFSRLRMGEGEIYFKYSAEKIEKMKSGSYTELFLKN